MGLIDETVPSLTVASAVEKTYGGSALQARIEGALGTMYTAGVTRAAWEKGSGMRFDPAPAYLFYVELSGILVALFTGCSGLGVSREQDSVKEGGVNNYVHKLPGRLTHSNIVLKRGLSAGRGLWDWMAQGRYDCKVMRINFSIIQGAPGHNFAMAVAGAAGMPVEGVYQAFGQGFGIVKHWDVENAWPVSWKLSDLDTSSDKVAIETLEVAHHGVSLSIEQLTPMSLTSGWTGLF